MSTAETVALPTVEVGGKAFPVGTVTLHQLFAAKQLVVDVVMNWRIQQAKRNAEIAVSARLDMQQEVTRSRLATLLGVGVEALDEAQAMSLLIGQKLGEMGVSDDPFGIALDIIGNLSESQLVDVVRLMLDRESSTRVTREFVEKHFDLGWFIDALVYFLEGNHIPSLVKNLQRLATITRMQAMPPAETSETSTSTPNSNDA